MTVSVGSLYCNDRPRVLPRLAAGPCSCEACVCGKLAERGSLRHHRTQACPSSGTRTVPMIFARFQRAASQPADGYRGSCGSGRSGALKAALPGAARSCHRLSLSLAECPRWRIPCSSDPGVSSGTNDIQCSNFIRVY